MNLIALTANIFRKYYQKMIGKLQYLLYLIKKGREKTKVFLIELKKINYPMSKRVIYENLCKFVNFPTYITRKFLANQVIKAKGVNVDREQGFMVWKPEQWEPLNEAITFARQSFSKFNLKEIVANSEGKHRYFLALPIKQELSRESPLVKLALNPEIISIVTEYLGILPIFSAVNILYSPNTKNYEDSSQFFHLDPEGVRQIKIFVFVEDVTEDSGPLTVVAAKDSKKVYPVYKGGRISDEKVKEFVPEENFQTMTGSSGTMVFTDTSSCFHFGSRTAKKDRFVFIIQYISPFSLNFPWFGWKRKARLAHLANSNSSTLEKYLLGAK